MAYTEEQVTALGWDSLEQYEDATRRGNGQAGACALYFPSREAMDRAVRALHVCEGMPTYFLTEGALAQQGRRLRTRQEEVDRLTGKVLALQFELGRAEAALKNAGITLDAPKLPANACEVPA